MRKLTGWIESSKIVNVKVNNLAMKSKSLKVNNQVIWLTKSKKFKMLFSIFGKKFLSSQTGWLLLLGLLKIWEITWKSPKMIWYTSGNKLLSLNRIWGGSISTAMKQIPKLFTQRKILILPLSGTSNRSKLYLKLQLTSKKLEQKKHWLDSHCKKLLQNSAMPFLIQLFQMEMVWLILVFLLEIMLSDQVLGHSKVTIIDTFQMLEIRSTLVCF